MERLARGDKDALGPLMERHYGRLYRVALAYLRSEDDALDAVQEGFVKAFQNAARWDPRAEVGPWLTRIVVNQSIDQYRRGRRRAARMEALVPGDHDERIAVVEPSPERSVMGREVGETIRDAVLGLPEMQRAVFVLRHYEELSLEEIARALRISLGTVKSSLHRAVHRLRAQLTSVRA
jgi:RNA polymerase sigma-70 factor (ECF subfamily)